jgi:hypothetical protein
MAPLGTTPPQAPAGGALRVWQTLTFVFAAAFVITLLLLLRHLSP